MMRFGDRKVSLMQHVLMQLQPECDGCSEVCDNKDHMLNRVVQCKTYDVIRVLGILFR